MKYVFLILVLPLIMGIAGCYYDNEEELYAGIACDTSNVTYSGTIAPIVEANCNVCHGGTSPSGGVVTETYAGLSAVAKSGRLWDAVAWIDNVNNMPQGKEQLPQCDLDKIDIWIRAGSPDN